MGTQIKLDQIQQGSASSGHTIRFDGTNWAYSSLLQNDGTYVSIGEAPNSSYQFLVKQPTSSKGLYVARNTDSGTGIHLYHNGAGVVESVGGYNLRMKSASGSILELIPGGGGGQIRQVSVAPGANITSVENNASILGFNATFAPTSSGGDFSGVNIEVIVNQTGAADGITRGLKITPILTAVTNEFRSLEIDLNTSGAKGIYQSGTNLTNYLAGATTIGSTTAPNSTALLQLDSTTKGLLLPRLTTTERDAISSPPDGLIVYNTTTDNLAVRANGSWAELSGSGVPLTDGDKGDITVSSSGATWTIDNDVVTYAKMQNVSATNRILGRSSSGSGDVEEITVGGDLTQSGSSFTVVSASTSTAGKVELATTGETNAGTDTTRAVTPDSLAGSIYGSKCASILVSDPTGSAITTGDSKAYLRIDEYVAGMNLVSVGASLTTASSSGNVTVQVRRVRSASSADMLSTAITIESSEVDSKDATTQPVINTSNDDTALGDQIYIDIDGAGTGAKGLNVTLVFQTP